MKVKLEIRHYMIAFLSILAIVGMLKYEFQSVFIHMFIAVLTAVVVDSIINYIKLKRIIISPSTIITGLIVGEVLSFDFPLYIPLISSTLAILSKQFIFYQNKHIFNPAGFGMLIVSLFFNNPVTWWGLTNIWLGILFGLFILYKLRKYELTLSYLLAHTIIILLVGYFTSRNILSYIGLTNIYFIAFMLIEPITSPVKKKARIVYGSLAAILSVIGLFAFTIIDHSIIGLLIANVFARILDKRLG